LTTASGNIGIDVNFGTNMTDSQNVITIGDDGDGTVLNATDRTYIGNIRGLTVGNADGVNVIIDSDGQLGTINSWCQFKKTFNRWIKPASHPGAQTGHVSLQEQDTKKTEAHRNLV
jgi:hypothetical protein